MCDKFTSHAPCPHTKHDGEGTKQGSGISACDIHMVHNSSACCGLVSIGALHPKLLTLPLPVYLPLLYSALSTLSTCKMDLSVEMCAVILTHCSVVHKNECGGNFEQYL